MKGERMDIELGKYLNELGKKSKFDMNLRFVPVLIFSIAPPSLDWFDSSPVHSSPSLNLSTDLFS